MSGLYTNFISGALFPLHELLKRHGTVDARRSMEKTQWWTPEQLRGLQLERLQSLTQSAFENVPYYRDLMQSIRFEPRDIRRLEDLRRFPLLTKTDIRMNREALKADGAAHLSRFNTGGSSGEPLVFYIGKERVSHDVAAKWRATRWWDVDIGDREIVVWGSPIELSAQDRVRALRDRLLRTRLLPAFEMSESNLDGFVAEIRGFRPRMLFGYPSSLALIAAHARKRRQRMDDLGIKVAFVTSERLYDEQREAIERVFACPVANGYGGRDIGFVAHACPEGRLHITAEDIIVETLSPEGKPVPFGEAGEIVITHLATRDFPFIRYRTGDVGVLSPDACPCGRGLPLLAAMQGRTTDFVVAQDGTIMHGLALIYVIRDLQGISSFKIIQESLDHTRVQLVPDDHFEQSQLATIEQGIKERLGRDVRVDLELLREITPESSGKFRYIVSAVGSQARVAAAASLADHAR
jgi:phenylacetate-CoA ligase